MIFMNLFFTRPARKFFADGVSIGNYYKVLDKNYILFMGWQSPKNSHWRGDIGRLLLSKDLTLSLDKLEPFIGSDDFDPISLSYPWVHRKMTIFIKYGTAQPGAGPKMVMRWCI